jgi:hypothetical protein
VGRAIVRRERLCYRGLAIPLDLNLAAVETTIAAEREAVEMGAAVPAGGRPGATG